MRFCSGLPVRAVRIASPLCPASDKTQDILFSVLGTEPVPWAPIQHSASSSPVRTTFYLVSSLRWKDCCVRFSVISSFSQKYLSQAALPLSFHGYSLLCSPRGFWQEIDLRNGLWIQPGSYQRSCGEFHFTACLILLHSKCWIIKCCFTYGHCCSTRQPCIMNFTIQTQWCIDAQLYQRGALQLCTTFSASCCKGSKHTTAESLREASIFFGIKHRNRNITCNLISWLTGSLITFPCIFVFVCIIYCFFILKWSHNNPVWML